MINKVHKDCPFTHDEIQMSQAMLYNANSDVRCMNPPHPSWISGYQNWQLKQKHRNRRKHKHFEPFQKVLVNWNGTWVPDFYERWSDKENGHYTIARNDSFFEDNEIVPYSGNEALLGKEVE